MKDNLRFYICDDDINFAESIKQQICSCIKDGRQYKIDIFDNAEALLNRFYEKSADAVLIDIDMPEMDGFEAAALLQKYRKNILIVFVTSYEDKVFQSYEYHPFWFVRKSHMHDLKIVTKKLLRKIDAEEEERNLTYNLKTDKNVIELDINKLMYIESNRNDIFITDKSGNEIKVRCKISEAEKQLYPLNIIRIQHGILVNCRYISKITSREVILTDGRQFNIGRSKLEYVRKEYQNFIRSRI